MLLCDDAYGRRQPVVADEGRGDEGGNRVAVRATGIVDAVGGFSRKRLIIYEECIADVDREENNA